jgi:hypothetical protein
MVLVLVVAAFFAGIAVQRRETERVRIAADEARALAEAERVRAFVSERQARLVADQRKAELAKGASSGK